MNAILGFRADTWRWKVFIDDADWGVWDSKEGGDVDSDETTYKPGNMANPHTLGGSRNVENLTLRRNYRADRDHARSQVLIDKVGTSEVVCTGQPLDYDKNPYGVPFSYRGRLKRVSFPDHDSTSNEAAMVEIEVTVDGMPTGMRST